MKHAYTYTVLRYVHDIATGEFVNVGVVLYAPAVPYASASCRPTYRRISGLFPGLDGEAFKRQMRTIQARLEELGARLSGELPFEDAPDSIMTLVHGVLPADDSSLQWSTPGGGVTSDPSRTLEQLYRRLVAKYDEKQDQHRRDDEEVWRKYKKNLESLRILKYFRQKKIVGKDDEVTFPHAWKNGLWHCLEPVSFDLASADSIREKAHRLLGRMLSVEDAKAQFKLYLLMGEPRDENLRPAYEKAVNILRKLPVEHELVSEAKAGEFTRKLEAEINEHTARLKMTERF